MSSKNVKPDTGLCTQQERRSQCGQGPFHAWWPQDILIFVVTIDNFLFHNTEKPAFMEIPLFIYRPTFLLTALLSEVVRIN